MIRIPDNPWGEAPPPQNSPDADMLDQDPWPCEEDDEEDD